MLSKKLLVVALLFLWGAGNMVDLSSANPRTTRASKSSGEVRVTTQPVVKSRDFAREVAAGAQAVVGRGLEQQGQSLQRLSSVLGNFFDRNASQEAELDHLNELQDIDQENAQFATEAANTVLQRPKAFRQALETGDWSAFPEVSVDQQSRAAFIDTGRKLLGQLDARKMAGSTEFLTALNQSGDPDQARVDFLAKELEGADALYAASTRTEFYSQTDQAVAERKAGIQLQAAETMRDRAITNMLQSLPEISGIADLMPHVGAVRRATAVLGPRAQQQAEDSLYLELLRKGFTEGSANALRIVTEKDPNWHDGLSVVERFPDQVRAANDLGAQRFGMTANRDQAQAVARVTEALTLGDVQGALQGVSEFEDRWPGVYNDQITTLKGKIIGALGDDTNQNIALEMALQGRNALSTSESRKVDSHVIQNFFPAAVQAGMDTPTAIGTFGSWLRDTPLSDNAKGLLSNILHGNNVEARGMLLQSLRGMPNYLRSSKLTGEDSQLASFLLETIEAGEDPEAAFEETKLKGLPEFSRSEVLSKLYGMTTEDERNFVNDVLDDADINKDDATPRLRAFADGTVRRLARRFPNLPQERLAKMAANELADRTIQVMINGEVVPDLSEGIQVTADGVPLRSMTKDELEDAADWFKGQRLEPGLDPVSGRRQARSGEFFRPPPVDLELSDLVVDADTINNAGYVPHFEHTDGSVRPLIFNVGDVHYVKAEDRDNALWNSFADAPEGVPDPGGLRAQGFVPVMIGDTGDQMIDERLMWRFDDADNQLMLRYVGEDTSPETVLRRLEDRYISGQAPRRQSQADQADLSTRRGRRLHSMQKRMAALLDSQDARNRLSFFEPQSENDVMRNFDEAREFDRANGTFLLDYASPEGQEFYNEIYTPFLIQQEGIRYQVYDDATGKPLGPGDRPRGDRTIGIGFNLERFGNAGQVLRQAGVNERDIPKIFNGEKSLNRQQVEAINAIVSTRAARTLWDRYKSVASDMTAGQWTALMSLHHHGVRNTPELTEAILRGDWIKAADEVLFRSEAGIRREQLTMIRARRIKEAELLLGGRAYQEPFIDMFRRAKGRLVG